MSKKSNLDLLLNRIFLSFLFYHLVVIMEGTFF